MTPSYSCEIPVKFPVGYTLRYQPNLPIDQIAMARTVCSRVTAATHR